MGTKYYVAESIAGMVVDLYDFSVLLDAENHFIERIQQFCINFKVGELTESYIRSRYFRGDEDFCVFGFFRADDVVPCLTHTITGFYS